MAVESIIDVNVTLGRWPTRRVACDQLPRLVAKLREHGVVEAWAGSFDGLFHDDLTAVNNELARKCAEHNREGAFDTVNDTSDGSAKRLRLLSFGEINPLLPNWQTELDRCATHHRMAGIRLHPNYHGYQLDHPEFARLLSEAVARNVVVQLTVLMEDERMMHPLMRVPAVDLSPIRAIVEQTPGLQLVLLNAMKGRPDDNLIRLLNMPGVYADIAMLEGAAALEQLVTHVPIEKILFGSHAPSLYFEAAAQKLKESSLPVPHLRAITQANARAISATKK
jgi:hypothetical protein